MRNIKINPITNYISSELESTIINLKNSKKTKIPKIEVSKWMKELWENIKDKQMHTLIIPGTHDSGSYSCNFNFGVAPYGPSIIQKKYITCAIQKNILSWTKTQPNNILSQLNDGARYLDMRVCVSVIDNEIRTEHSIYGTTYNDLLDQVYTFIINNKNEFIILNFRHFGKETYYGMSPTDHTRVVNLIHEKLGDFLVLKEEQHLTLEQLLEKNHRIFAIYNEETIAKKYKNLLSGDAIWNPWTASHNPIDLVKTLNNYCSIFKVKKEPIFFSMQSCITPNKKMLLDFIGKKMCGSFLVKKYKNTPCSLVQVAIEANNATFQWIINQTREKTDRPFNIVSFDWLHIYSDFVLYLIHLN